jgi:hypothetical protein
MSDEPGTPGGASGDERTHTREEAIYDPAGDRVVDAEGNEVRVTAICPDCKQPLKSHELYAPAMCPVVKVSDGSLVWEPSGRWDRSGLEG